METQKAEAKPITFSRSTICVLLKSYLSPLPSLPSINLSENAKSVDFTRVKLQKRKEKKKMVKEKKAQAVTEIKKKKDQKNFVPF